MVLNVSWCVELKQLMNDGEVTQPMSVTFLALKCKHQIYLCYVDELAALNKLFSEEVGIFRYFLTVYKPNLIIWSLNIRERKKILIFWMQIVTKINLLLCSGCLGGLSLIPLCEPNSSVPTWPLHHKPIHVNLTHSADRKRSTLALEGTRDCAIMNTPVPSALSQWVGSLGPFE